MNADEQARFARAVTGGTPASPAEARYAALLAAKRRAELVRCLPALAAALGPRLEELFAQWWRTAAHNHADFRAALLDAGRQLARAVPAARRSAVDAELLRWRLGRRGPFIYFGDGALWFRLRPGGRLRRLPLVGQA